MSPEEIRMVVDKAIRDGLYFPWWSYVLYFTIAMFGAWCGAYFRRKGEDQATYENYSRLREQLRKTTQDTEEIKATLLGKSWLTQQQWSIREQHYMSLLRHLTKLKLSLEDRSSYYIEPGSEYNENPPSQEEQALMQAGHESYQQFVSLLDRPKYFCPTKQSTRLRSLSMTTGASPNSAYAQKNM